MLLHSSRPDIRNTCSDGRTETHRWGSCILLPRWVYVSLNEEPAQMSHPQERWTGEQIEACGGPSVISRASSARR